MRLLELLLIAFILYSVFRLLYARLVAPFLRGYTNAANQMRNMKGNRPNFGQDDARKSEVEQQQEQIDRSNVKDAEFRDLD